MRLPNPFLLSFLLVAGANLTYFAYKHYDKKKEVREIKPPALDTGLAIPQYYSYLRPLTRFLDPEGMHNAAMRILGAPRFLRAGLGLLDATKPPESLRTTVFGIDFANPVGIAAGFDKNGLAVDGCLDMGFGFVEVGSVTPRPQSGNARPRLFRLDEDLAVINRYGFNSAGCENVADFLHRRLFDNDKENIPLHLRGLVGVNLGKNKHTPNDRAIDDYVSGIKVLGPYANYLVVNVSSPNTPGLRDLQQEKELRTLIKGVLDARATLSPNTFFHPVPQEALQRARAVLNTDSSLAARRSVERLGRPPVLLKISPDTSLAERQTIARVCLEEGVDGLIVSNTTTARPETLLSSHRNEVGGLSGLPLRDTSTQAIADMYTYTKGRIPIIGVGGVFDGKDAYEKVRAGASLVQLYTSLAYEGPMVGKRVREGLAAQLEQDGYKNIKDAVGADADLWRTDGSD